MNSQATRQHLGAQESKRPVGIWIVAIVHVVFAAYWIFRISPGLSEPLPPGWDEASVPFTRFVVALYIGMIATVLGAWFGNAGFRNLFLGVLTIVICLFIREDYLAIMFFLVRKEVHVDLPLATRLGLMAAPLMRLSWLVLQYWYLLGPRTRSFYRKAPDRMSP